jgi:hypothetical protein
MAVAFFPEPMSQLHGRLLPCHAAIPGMLGSIATAHNSYVASDRALTRDKKPSAFRRGRGGTRCAFPPNVW